MMAKPMKTLDLHYPVIQFLIIPDMLPSKTCTRTSFQNSFDPEQIFKILAKIQDLIPDEIKFMPCSQSVIKGI